ncbi:MAG: hypothetical protein ACRDBG_04610 [Waterburya sp.]
MSPKPPSANSNGKLPLYPTAEVYYYDLKSLEVKEVVKIRPVAVSLLREMTISIESLLNDFLQAEGNVGQFLASEVAINQIKNIAALIPVVNSEKVGIDIDNLMEAGDICQIAKLFLTEAYDYDSPEKFDEEIGLYRSAIYTYRPTSSTIARLHGINFFPIVRNYLQGKLLKEEEKENQLQPT